MPPRSRNRKKAIAALGAVAIAGIGLAFYTGHLSIPNRWNPWAALIIADEPNILTRYKLARLTDGSLCKVVLAQAQMNYSVIADHLTGEGCGFTDAVRIAATSAAVGEPFALSCQAAVALALWEYHVVQPAAQRHYGVPVARLQHYGSYACRNIYSREGAHRSRHATAEALDVAGFMLAGGQRITVRNDWKDDGPEALFLREVHAGACKFFDAVLGPEYNAAHFNHFISIGARTVSAVDARPVGRDSHPTEKSRQRGLPTYKLHLQVAGHDFSVRGTNFTTHYPILLHAIPTDSKFTVRYTA